jgi:hypothetical protein
MTWWDATAPVLLAAWRYTPAVLSTAWKYAVVTASLLWAALSWTGHVVFVVCRLVMWPVTTLLGFVMVLLSPLVYTAQYALDSWAWFWDLLGPDLVVCFLALFIHLFLGRFLGSIVLCISSFTLVALISRAAVFLLYCANGLLQALSIFVSPIPHADTSWTTFSRQPSHHFISPFIHTPYWYYSHRFRFTLP